METITFFTTKLEDPILFEGSWGRIPVFSEELSEVLLDVFQLDNNTKIKEVWNGLDDDSKKKCIIDFSPDYESKIDKWVKRANEKENVRKDIWEKEKNKIIGKSNGDWAVYAAPKHDGVYAMHCLRKPRPVKEWAEALIRICKTIDAGVQRINLILHDMDFGGTFVQENMYVFRDSDNINYELDELKSKYSLEELKIITFKHSNGVSVLRVLNGEYKNTTVHEAIDSIIEEASV